MSLSIIVAMSPNHAIGFNGALPWNIPEDMVHFKQLTMGHTIVMGRKTYESLPHGALPGRHNVVISRTINQIPKCDVFPSFSSLCNSLSYKGKDEEIFVIGGASIYAEALPFADKLYITLVDDNPKQADTFFPAFNLSEWTETKKEKHKGFSFINLSRR